AALVAGVALVLHGRPTQVVETPTPQPSPQTTPQPSAPPSPLPTRPHLAYTPAPEGSIAPIVVQRTPARGAELRPDGAVELVFDRRLDHAAVEAAFSTVPAVAGAIEWADARTLRFRPAQPLPRASIYDVLLGQGARAQDGAPLNGAYQFRFATAGFLEVGQV